MPKPFFVYMLASRRNGTLYIGHTEHLAVRVRQHKTGERSGFAHRYGATRLVWYELHDRREDALTRERQMKKWNRAWKIRLIEETNPDWEDLYEKENLSF